MRSPRYSPAQFSELLGIDKRRLLDLEREGALPKAKRDPATDFRYYLPEEAADYRKLLNLPPVVRSHRRQLFLNFKGGTGKSSISASYGYRAAELGARTLLVDLDPQGHLTRCLGFNGSDFELTLYEVLIDKHDIRDAVVETGMKTLHLLPANIRLSPIELSLMSQNAREWRLRRALEPLSSTYDLVVLDSPPNIGLLNLNAILVRRAEALIRYSCGHRRGLRLSFERHSYSSESFQPLTQHMPSLTSCFAGKLSRVSSQIGDKAEYDHSRCDKPGVADIPACAIFERRERYRQVGQGSAHGKSEK